MTELVTLAARVPMPVATRAGNRRSDPPPAREFTTPHPNAATATTTRSTDMAAQARHLDGSRQTPLRVRRNDADGAGTDVPAPFRRGGAGNRTRVQGFAGPCLSHSATSPSKVALRGA